MTSTHLKKIREKVGRLLGEPQEVATSLLLQELKNSFAAGFIFQNEKRYSVLKNYFIRDSFSKLPSKVLPRFCLNGNLKPAVLKNFSMRGIFVPEDAEWVHFCLDPDRDLSLVVVITVSLSERRKILMDTQALIQRYFYD